MNSLSNESRSATSPPPRSAKPIFIYAYHWPSVVVKAIVVIGMVVIIGSISSYFIGSPWSYLVGAIVTAIYFRAIRPILIPDFLAGLAHFRRMEFDSALHQFERGLHALERHPWIDRGRAWVLGWSSPFSLKAMYLFYIGTCHLKAKRVGIAKDYFRQVLEFEPENNLALGSLEMIETIEESLTGTTDETRA